MSVLPLKRVFENTLCVGIVAFLVSPVAAAPATRATQAQMTVPPGSVLASQRLHDRWISGFNGWRGAKWTWPGETAREAELRSQTRLLISPSSTPLISAERRVDGNAIVISSGLIAVVEELLLAETVGIKGEPSGCFGIYSGDTLKYIKSNRSALSRVPAGVLQAWPRLTTLVQAEKARDECAGLTPAALRSASTSVQVAAATDALVMWLLTWQNLRLASLPDLHPPRERAEAVSAASAAKEAASALADICPASAASDPERRASAAGKCIDRPAPRTAQWLLENREDLAPPDHLAPKR